MKVLHLIGGGDVGGAKSHVLSLVKELGNHIDVKIISFRTGIFSADAKEMGINIEVVKTGNIFNDIKSVLNIIKNEKYNLLHSHGAKANMVACVIKSFISVPTVTTVHSDYKLDYIDNVFKKYSFGAINTLALRYIDYYIGVSNEFQNMLVDRKFSPERLFSLYNGISFDENPNIYTRKKFFDKLNLNIDENSTIIGILARLHPIKGIDIFLKAAQLVLKNNKNVHFFIGGDGEERDLLEEVCSNLGLNDNVHFLGFLNDPYEFMEIIDINILSSHSESFPYVILEGAKQKKATISSNVGGIKDLIKSEINGFLFEPGDFSTLANHMITLINNPSIRKEMGEKIYESAFENYSLVSMCNTQLSIYKSILNSTNASALKSKSSYDIIISGYYGFNNIGDDAMLMSILDDIKSLKSNLRFLILSKNPIQSKKRYLTNSINRFNFFKLIKIMMKSKLLIYGGGNLIQDNTSTRSLIYYLLVIWLAKKFGMKVMLYGNGLGPLNKKINRKLSTRILNQVDVITLREKTSLTFLKSLGVTNPKLSLTADPALSVSFQKPLDSKYLFEKNKIPTDKPIVGFSVRPWSNSKQFVSVISKVADYLVDKYGITPLFIPMHHPKDHMISEQIISSMKNKGYLVPNQSSVLEILSVIKSCKILVGMRLHALIFAVKLEIPVVGLSYEPKVKGFLNYIDQNHILNVQDIEFNKLVNLIENVYKNASSIKEELKEKNVFLKKLALKNPKLAVELLDQLKGHNT